ncbi:MAG: YdcH family protein [Acidiferrobacteraceae bacterium]
MIDEEAEMLRQRLAALRSEHCDLDAAIARLSTDPLVDQLHLRRLKKRKLLLKDQISRLQSRMIPDLNA